ncbi:MAG TPA: hypothetical protein VK493_08395 [Bryobacteraceae bacterium]|nr:hypothetical protein [Bryobacteraceae bacterium]
MDTKPAALEYARQMRLALCQQGGPLLHRPLTFGYWKRRFDVELARARERERMRMALSQDWSGLGKYFGESLLILRHSIALDAAGILSRLRCPGALKLFEPSVAVILRTVFQCRAGWQPVRDWQSRLGF